VKRPTQAMGCRRDADNKRLCKAFRKGWRGHLVGDPSLSGEHRLWITMRVEPDALTADRRLVVTSNEIGRNEWRIKHP